MQPSLGDKDGDLSVEANDLGQHFSSSGHFNSGEINAVPEMVPEKSVAQVLYEEQQAYQDADEEIVE